MSLEPSNAHSSAEQIPLRKIEKVLTVVDRSLRMAFQTDFDRRCAYAVFGIRSLLQDIGCTAQVFGGDFLAFVVSRDGMRAGLQGFGGGETQCSHFWVETEERIIDLGPHYLPKSSSFPVVRMPAVAWKKNGELPLYLRYKPLQAFPESVSMSSIETQNARCEQFVQACRERFAGQLSNSSFPTWLATDHQSVVHASRRDDWANAALRFGKECSSDSLPF
jgi:hypothetical protein